MKKFFFLLTLLCFLTPNSYAKKTSKVQKNKQNCFKFFAYADEDKDNSLSPREFEKIKKYNKKLKNTNKINCTKEFKVIDADSDGVISDIEYKEYCIAKNEKFKKDKKKLKAKRSRTESNRAPINKSTNKANLIEPVIAEPETNTEAATTDQETKENLDILDSIKDSD